MVESASTDARLIVAGQGTGGTTLERADTGRLGFFGTVPQAKPTVSGSRGGNAALQSLVAALAGMGLVADATTA